MTPHPSPEVDPTTRAYARSERIPGPTSSLALAMIKAKLDVARNRAQAKAAKRISAEPCFGDPGREIITAAADRRAHLIVVGSRGHGRLCGEH